MVTVNGVYAPLFYVSAGQITFQVPYETATGTASVVVTNDGLVSTAFSVAIAAAAPGVFTTGGTAALAQNADGSVNSATHPAPTGSIVSFFATGVGGVNPSVADGESAPANFLSIPAAASSATIGGIAATISSIGLEASGGLSVLFGNVGVAQANIQIPNGLANGTYVVVLTVNGVASNAATVVVGPAAPIVANGSNLGTFPVGTLQLGLSATSGSGTYTWSLVSARNLQLYPGRNQQRSADNPGVHDEDLGDQHHGPQCSDRLRRHGLFVHFYAIGRDRAGSVLHGGH
jgi:uncharacterized protein (TIGR03437 family)